MRQVIVFLKYPEPGKVKTRLAAAVGPQAAARLARRFAEETLDAARSLGLPVAVCFAPAEREGQVRAWLGPGLSYFPQQGRDLGERMHGAFAAAFARGAERVVLVGTDAPDRPAAFFTDALELLAGRDVVLGPALDGGYQLMAMRRDAFAPEAFCGMAWGTGLVLAQTLDALRRAGRTVAVLPPWRDIDDRAGLEDYLQGHPAARILLEESHEG